MLLAGARARFGGAVGDDHAVAERLQHIGEGRSHFGAAGMKIRIDRPCGGTCGAFGGGTLLGGRAGVAGDRQGEPELRAFAGLAVEADIAARLFDDALGHGQAQARALFACAHRRNRRARRA